MNVIWHHYDLEKDQYSSVGGLMDPVSSSCPYSSVSQRGARAGALKVCVQASELWRQPGPELVHTALQSAFRKAGLPVSRVPTDAHANARAVGQKQQPALSRSQGSVSTQNLCFP